MPRIDRFIEAMFKHQAEGLVLQAGEKAVLSVGGADRPLASPPAPAKLLDEALREIAPSELRDDLAQDGEHALSYASPHGAVRVCVTRSGDALRLDVSADAEAQAAAASEAAPADGANQTGIQGGNGATEDAGTGVTPTPAGSANGSSSAGLATASEATPGATAAPGVQRFDGASPLPASAARERMDALFQEMVREGCSDLHLSSTCAPLFRKDGGIALLSQREPIAPDAMRELLYSITPEARRTEFEERMDTDFSYEIPGVARFRCNVFMDRNGIGGVFRVIPSKILTATDLNLPSHILDLCSLTKGLVVVTGPTGSGKSTTLAAMIDHINDTRSEHIITIEDPIEFVHPNKKCLINQREVSNHTMGFKPALRAALREDPDIVLVGEMRDLETVEIAIETAETGHLVFGTLHTNTAPSTVDRVIDQFPSDRQGQIRTMLSESLKGVVAQTLCRKKGGGRVAALEILIANAAVSNLIREGKTFQIPSAMQTGRKIGMQTLNDALLEHVKSGAVEPAEAYAKAVARDEFRAQLQGAGISLDVAEPPK